jgi:hypothetical protein
MVVCDGMGLDSWCNAFCFAGLAVVGRGSCFELKQEIGVIWDDG